jgi:hypothetical protein
MSTGGHPNRRWAPEDDGYDKHLPEYQGEWGKIVESTRNGGIAKYHPDLTHEQIRSIEMTLDVSRQFYGSEDGGYFYQLCTRIIGASDGEETDIVFIKAGNCGAVHGQPITKSHFRRLWNKYRSGEPCPL